MSRTVPYNHAWTQDKLSNALFFSLVGIIIWRRILSSHLLPRRRMPRSSICTPSWEIDGQKLLSIYQVVPIMQSRTIGIPPCRGNISGWEPQHLQQVSRPVVVLQSLQVSHHPGRPRCSIEAQTFALDCCRPN